MKDKEKLHKKYSDKLENARNKRERAIAGEHKFQFEFYNIEFGIYTEIVADLEKFKDKQD